MVSFTFIFWMLHGQKAPRNSKVSPSMKEKTALKQAKKEVRSIQAHAKPQSHKQDHRHFPKPKPEHFARPRKARPMSIANGAHAKQLNSFLKKASAHRQHNADDAQLNHDNPKELERRHNAARLAYKEAQKARESKKLKVTGGDLSPSAAGKVDVAAGIV